jgi:hypothetical protein
MSERIDCNNEEVYKSTRDKLDYQNGKIYKVWTLLGTEIYIGSTAQKLLSSRMNNHRNSYNKWKKGKANKVTVYDLFDKYGVENCKIELIEKFPCRDYLELEAREGHHQRLHRDIIVNRHIAGRTRAEYRVENADRLNAVSRHYYVDNAEAINKKKSEKITCDCGCIINHGGKSHHIKSIKHQKLMESIPP